MHLSFWLRCSLSPFKTTLTLLPCNFDVQQLIDLSFYQLLLLVGVDKRKLSKIMCINRIPAIRVFDGARGLFLLVKTPC